MKKDAFWFHHDSNARTDDKVVRLRRLSGLEGVGLYWCVIECLREASGYQLPEHSIADLCFDLRCDKKVFDFLFECDLLKLDNECFYSPSLTRRMKNYDQVCKKRSKAGRLGGKAKAKQMSGKSEAIVVAKPSDLNGSDKNGSDKKETKKEQKKERMISGIDPFNPKSDPDFVAVQSLYPKKTAPVRAYRAWQEVCDHVALETITGAIQSQLDACMIERSQYTPDLASWLTDGRWDDEIIETEKSKSNKTNDFIAECEAESRAHREAIENGQG